MVAERRLKILFCGYGHLGLALLQGLLACPELCEVVGVFRWISRPGGEQYWDTIEETLKQTVTDAGLLDIQCPGMNSFEFATLLETLEPDVVLVGSWGEILKPHILNRENLLFINCHPSKLPAHRGANPYASVILHNEAETGVTFHRMVAQIDAGAILMQSAIPLVEHDTGESVRDKCSAAAYAMTPSLVQQLYQHCLGQVPLAVQEQEHSIQSYYPPLKTEDGLLTWAEDAITLYRHCRALYPWIVCYGHLDGGRIVLFFSPRFVPRPEGLPDMKPGSILSFKEGVLMIALNDPEWVMEVPHYQLAGLYKGYWPIWLSRFMAKWMFKPGRRFMGSRA